MRTVGKIAVLLANGCEEIEAIALVDMLRRAGVDVVSVSITGDKKVVGSHLIEITADQIYSEVNFEHFSGVILPGGMPGSANLRDSQWVIDFIKAMDEKTSLIAAICAAPIALDKAGVLNGHRFSCYPGVEDLIKHGTYEVRSIVVDDHIITGYGPGVALQFGLAVVRYLCGNDIADALQNGMVI